MNSKTRSHCTFSFPSKIWPGERHVEEAARAWAKIHPARQNRRVLVLNDEYLEYKQRIENNLLTPLNFILASV